MLDVDTFLTTLYVMVDDFCHSHSPTPKKPGPQASLCASEVITLAIFARWGRFSSERDFYRYATTSLCAMLFPLCQIARSSTASSAITRSSSKPSWCIWSLSWTLKGLLTKLWIARRCPSGTVSVEDMDGWPVVQTSDGPTAWDGMRALACSPPQTLPGS
jgi:hypothetical protein